MEYSSFLFLLLQRTSETWEDWQQQLNTIKEPSRKSGYERKSGFDEKQSGDEIKTFGERVSVSQPKKDGEEPKKSGQLDRKGVSIIILFPQLP